MILDGVPDFRKHPSPTVSRYMTQPMRRTRVRTVLAVLFGLFTLEAWAEVLLATLGGSDSPRALTALQTAVGVAGVFATRGIGPGARWAPAAAVVYGRAIHGLMLVALPLILGLEPEARRGIWLAQPASCSVRWESPGIFVARSEATLRQLDATPTRTSRGLTSYDALACAAASGAASASSARTRGMTSRP